MSVIVDDLEHSTAFYEQVLGYARGTDAAIRDDLQAAVAELTGVPADTGIHLRLVPRADEDGVAMTERVRTATCTAAAASLEGAYGHWIGFRQWAPQNADRVLSFLITGN